MASLRSAEATKAAVRRGKKKKEENFSYLMYSFKRVRCETPVWLLCISSVGHSIRGYVCADLLSIREGSPSKGGTHGTPSSSARHWSVYRLVWFIGQVQNGRGKLPYTCSGKFLRDKIFADWPLANFCEGSRITLSHAHRHHVSRDH